jgi:hypothetical protein
VIIQSIIAALTELFFPVTAAIGLLGGLFVIAARFTVSPPVKGYAIFLLAFGFLGGVTGLIAGVSRESIVGGLLTGLLGIISALLSYLFSKEALKEWRHYISYAIMLLVISALAGLSIGGIYKAKWEAFDRDYKKWALEYEKVYLEVLKEERLMKLRAQAKEGHEPQATAVPDKSVERDAPQVARPAP